MESKKVEKLVIKGIVYVPEKEQGSVTPYKVEEVTDLSKLIDKSFYFRTVTYHLTGKVVNVLAGKFLILKQAAWIADSGRFMQTIKEGTLNEVEPTGDAFINIDTITDFYPWVHKLPENQK